MAVPEAAATSRDRDIGAGQPLVVSLCGARGRALVRHRGDTSDAARGCPARHGVGARGDSRGWLRAVAVAVILNLTLLLAAGPGSYVEERTRDMIAAMKLGARTSERHG